MKSSICIILLFVSSLLFSQEQATVSTHEITGINFQHESWKEILAKAKAEKKLVMLDAYTTWCGPCKWMAKNIFTKDDVAAYYNSTFVNAKIDMEKGEGLEIAKKYKVQAYPTFLFVNGEGELVHRICGSMEAESFVTQGKTALDDKINFAGISKKFNENPKENAARFFEMTDAACVNAAKELDAYFKLLSKDEIVNPANFKLMYSIINSYDDASFSYLHANYATLVSKYGSDSLDQKLTNIYESALRRAGAKADAKKIDAIKSSYAIITKTKSKDYLNDMSALVVLDKSKQAKLYYEKQADFVDKYFMDDANALNSFAWDYYESVSDKKLLDRARNWSATSVKLDNNYANNDTYAAVLYKLGMKAEAKKSAEAAIELAKKSGEDAKETESLLKKIELLK